MQSLSYEVGALLYCPANSTSIVKSLINNKFPQPFSLALCLEDTINDNYVEDAIINLIEILTSLHYSQALFYRPKIFIRVRNSDQISYLLTQLGEAREIICGFILPKFTPDNANSYLSTIISANTTYNCTFYIMPILESGTIVPLNNRINILTSLNIILEPVKHLVLNIRVGGNDLCHYFGFRRNSKETIYRILPVASIFTDIITTFGNDYIVSGPVWEYYQGENWKEGLIQELTEDRLCGFIGKTVIHPNQIEVINQFNKIPRTDYEDALKILNWDISNPKFVSKNAVSERMNELKTHTNWAKRIINLANVYGIVEQDKKHI